MGVQSRHLGNPLMNPFQVCGVFPLLVFLDLSVGVYIPLYVPVIYFREIPYFSVPRCSIRKGCSFQEPESGTEVEVGTMLGSGAQGFWDVVRLGVGDLESEWRVVAKGGRFLYGLEKMFLDCIVVTVIRLHTIQQTATKITCVNKYAFIRGITKRIHLNRTSLLTKVS